MRRDYLRALMREYLSHLAVSGYSPRTGADKEFNITKFIEWCEARDIHTVTQVTRETMEKYQKHLYHYQSEVTGKQLSFFTQRARLSAISGSFGGRGGLRR